MQQRFILKEEVSISKNENESLLDSSGELLKAFDQANKVSQIPLPKPKFEIVFTKAKDELFSHCYRDIAEHLNRQIRISFWFENNKTCVFSIKKFEHYGDQFILTEVVNLGYREIKHLYKNRYFVAYKCDIFQRPKSVQEAIGDVYCPGKYCLNREKCESIGGYVTTPRSIYGCDNCGAWLFVHKVPFKLQEHVKTTKTDKTRFFFAKKHVTRQTNLHYCPISINQIWEGRIVCG